MRHADLLYTEQISVIAGEAILTIPPVLVIDSEVGQEEVGFSLSSQNKF